MCVAAFHLGLKDKLDELEEIVSKDNVLYHRGYTAGELRKLLIQDKLPEFINIDCLCSLSEEIVDLACDGLEQRGIGEEVFLNPLYDRIKRRSNPGKDVIKSVNNGTKIEKIIEDYGKLGITI
jgi:hypothetical protein